MSHHVRETSCARAFFARVCVRMAARRGLSRSGPRERQRLRPRVRKSAPLHGGCLRHRAFNLASDVVASNAHSFADAPAAARGLARERPSGHKRGDTRKTRPRTRCLSRVLTSCIVDRKVKRIVAHATGDWQRTQPESRVFAEHRSNSSRALGLARECSCGSTRADARSTRPCARCLPNVHI